MGNFRTFNPEEEKGGFGQLHMMLEQLPFCLCLVTMYENYISRVATIVLINNSFSLYFDAQKENEKKTVV